MSWSVTVNNVAEYVEFPLETLEFFASLHPSYPRDAANALALAKALGLKSAMLSGGRTPNIYGGDEIVDVNVRGTPVYNDFITEMTEIIRGGPSPDTIMARHWQALARLRANPCSHVFDTTIDGRQRCMACQVYLNGTTFYFEDDNG